MSNQKIPSFVKQMSSTEMRHVNGGAARNRVAFGFPQGFAAADPGSTKGEVLEFPSGSGLYLCRDADGKIHPDTTDC